MITEILLYLLGLFKIIFFPFNMMLYAFEETIKLFKLGLKLFFFPSIYIKDLILDILTFLLTNIFFHSKGILKYSFILLLFSLFSCIITALTYYLFSLPPITYKNFDLRFYNEEVLLTKLKINCSDDFCINGLEENYNYNVYIEMEILRNEKSISQGNFETEIQLISKQKKIKSYKKILFLQQNDSLTEKVTNIILLPFRLLGLYKAEKFKLKFIKNFSLSTFQIKNILIFLKNAKLNIKRGTLVFYPVSGWIKYFLNYIKILSIPIIFMISFAIQIILFLGSKLILDKYNDKNTYLDDNLDDETQDINNKWYTM